jgi:hypothetical protein
MADENIVEQPQTEQVAENPETSQETQADATQQETTETVEPEKADQEQTEPVQEQPQVEVKKYKIKVDGQEEEHDENELIELAQKGVAFSKKQQALADMEKAQQFKTQAFDQLVNDPSIMKAMFARQMGVDPAVVLQNLQPPDPAYKDTNPEWYYPAQSKYEIAMGQRQAVEQGVNAFIKQSSDATNVQLVARTKLKHDLNDQQANEVANFVNSRLKPGMFGMYSEADMDTAVAALYGKQRQEQDKLQTANNIRETIKRGVQSQPARATSQRKEELPQDVAEGRNFLNFIRELNASK